MKRSLALITGALLAASVLASCGDDSKSGGGSGTDDYCARVVAYKAKADEFGAIFSGTPDAAKVEEAYTTMQSMLHGLESGAPDEIKADVTTMSTAIDSVVKIMAQYDWDLTALGTAPEMAELQQTLSGSEMNDASARLEAFSTGTCGIASDTSTT
jgi:hypothetical protein